METRLTLQGFSRMVAAGTPLIFVQTANELRTEQLLRRTAAEVIKGLAETRVWNCIEGFGDGQTDPLAAVQSAISQDGTGLVLFKDMTCFWQDDPRVQRLLKTFASGRVQPGKTLVFLGQQAEIPPLLQDEMVVLTHQLPDAAELKSYFQQRRESEPLLQRLMTNEAALSSLVLAAQGLDLPVIERAIRTARVNKTAELEDLVRELFQSKKQVLERTGIMEFVDNDVTPARVGGVENLKSWMKKREIAFGAEDLAAGRNLPRGVLIMGVSGCGKSLLIKAIAGGWRLPLIRLDMSRVYDGTYGSPESSLRLACRTAEALAPCVLWIDEIEAGISSQGFKSEGGAAARVLGYFLTWMQEKLASVFVAATANAIELLPAEVLRKGRFDEIFYVELPDLVARGEIFSIHLRQRGFDPAPYNPDMLAHSAKGFAGSEIEQAVASAIVEAKAAGRQMLQQDIMVAIGKTVPLSVTMAEQLKQIEAWAFRRAVPASSKKS